MLSELNDTMQIDDRIKNVFEIIVNAPNRQKEIINELNYIISVIKDEKINQFEKILLTLGHDQQNRIKTFLYSNKDKINEFNEFFSFLKSFESMSNGSSPMQPNIQAPSGPSLPGAPAPAAPPAAPSGRSLTDDYSPRKPSIQPSEESIPPPKPSKDPLRSTSIAQLRGEMKDELEKLRESIVGNEENEVKRVSKGDSKKKKESKPKSSPRQREESTEFYSMSDDFDSIKKEEFEDEDDENIVENYVNTNNRDILIDYYSRMNINRIYEFKIIISKEKLVAAKKLKDLLTGEQKEQVTDQFEVVEELPIEVELVMPGCLVSPPVQYVSAQIDAVTLSFYVTPFVKYKDLEAKLILGQEKLAKKIIILPVTVIDSRIVKIFSIVGILIASIPSLWPFLFKVDMNEQILLSLRYSLPALTSPLLLGLEFGIGGLFIAVGGIFWKFYSSTKAKFQSTELLTK